MIMVQFKGGKNMYHHKYCYYFPHFLKFIFSQCKLTPEGKQCNFIAKQKASLLC